jgi:hypothetical protein
MAIAHERAMAIRCTGIAVACAPLTSAGRPIDAYEASSICAAAAVCSRTGIDNSAGRVKAIAPLVHMREGRFRTAGIGTKYPPQAASASRPAIGPNATSRNRIEPVNGSGLASRLVAAFQLCDIACTAGVNPGTESE